MKNGKVKLLVTQLCLILCDPINCSPPGSSVHGLLQARISPGDLPEPRSLALQADSLPSEPPWKPQDFWIQFISVFMMVWGEGNLMSPQNN